MSSVTAIVILGCTVLLSLVQPRVGPLTLRPHWAALAGALATVASGQVSLGDSSELLLEMLRPMTTLASLMAMTLIAEKVGLFDGFTRWLARASRGQPTRLFALLFFGGTMVGAVFTNDAAVLILTPLVIGLMGNIAREDWGPRATLPYLFAVLYVANLVGLFVISNPINIIAAAQFDISFLSYFKWMALPALSSFAVTYLALRYYFRSDFPDNYQAPPRTRVAPSSFRNIVAVVLSLTLVGFFTQGLTQLPLYAVALGGALLLALLYNRIEGGALAPIFKGIAWDVILFVVSIFVVARGIHNAGVTTSLGEWLLGVHEQSQALGLSATSGIAASMSAVMNNHPVAHTMTMEVASMGMPLDTTQQYILAALIGGDLGPKMLPIGSLAALLWFRLLRNHGIHVSYWEYIKLGVPVTLLAVGASVGVLILETMLF